MDRVRESTAPGSRKSDPSVVVAQAFKGARPPAASSVVERASSRAAAEDVHHRETARLRASQIEPLVEMTRSDGVTRRLQVPSVWPPRAAFPSTPPAEPAAPARTRRALAIGGAIAGLVAVAAAGYLLLRGRDPARVDAPVRDAAAVAPVIPAGVSTASNVTSPAPAVAADLDAREALDRLRRGLGECIRNGIHDLPGSSPAVPARLDALRSGAYAPAQADWRTPVWSCARFSVTAAMNFQLQWQLLKPGVEGVGLAWIDANGDGAPDRALGFRITLDRRGQPVLGEVEPMDPSRPVVRVP